jgi:Hereditary spastic paraplegia protein strumpellin.
MLEYFIIFRLETKQDQQKYGEIISDFSYFKMSDEFDHKIDNNPVSTGFFVIQLFM